MWIRRSEYMDLKARLAIEVHARELSDMRVAAAQVERTDLVAIRAFLENENRTLRERLIDAEAAARTGQALAAVWATRTNQLQAERDQLVTRLVPGLEIRTPHITPSGTQGVLEPIGVSFDHDPHGAAPPPDPITVPVDDDFPEATGQAYNPFADVREQTPDA